MPNGFWTRAARPRFIFVDPVFAEWIRGYRDPFEIVATREWLFRTFGIRGH